MLYDAFISYRHTPLDMEFAKKVHAGLETYHVPGPVRKKIGKKRIERVFRDQEELPIGSDLDENIAKALRESEYLIVICSPETPGSYWVAKEIDTFIKLHDRHHILAVLVDGEPDQSFPAQLLTDENGRPVEPLAADVRGETPKERNKKFKTELLRLAAPILGCTFDDLRQRHRERILKRNIAIAAVSAGIIAAAGAAFGIYNAGVAARMKKLANEKAELADEKAVLADEKSELADRMSKLADEKTKLADEILVEYREKQKNQSRFYAEEAMMQLQEGNREDAVLIASEGLPSEGNDRPFVAEAEYALAAALHAYDCGLEYSHDRCLPHDQQIRGMFTDSTGKYLTTVDYGKAVYVWDCDSCMRLLKLENPLSEKDNGWIVSAVGDSSGVVVAYEQCLVRYDNTGKETARFPFEAKTGQCVIADGIGTAFCVRPEKVTMVSLDDFTKKAEILCENPGESVRECKRSADGKYFVVGQYVNEDELARVTIADLNGLSSRTVTVSQGYILDFCITANGNVAVVSTNPDFFYSSLKQLTLDVFRAEDGEKLYSRDIPCEGWDFSNFKLLIGSRNYEEKGSLVLAAEGHAYSYDELTGDLKAQFALPGAAVTLHLSENSKTAFISCRNGDIIAINTEEGRIYGGYTISTNLMLDGMEVFDGGIALSSLYSTSVAVMKRLTASDLTELPGLPEETVGVGVAPSGKYYVLDGRGKVGSLSFYDADGNLLHYSDIGYNLVRTGFYGDNFLAVTRDGVILIDPFAGTEKEVTFESLGLSITCYRAVISSDGRYIAIRGSFRGVAVIDITEGQCVYRDDKLEKTADFALSGDGRIFLISLEDGSLLYVDIPTGTVTEKKEEMRIPSPFTTKGQCMVCDATGKYAAMACQDGYVRVLSLPECETVLKLPIQTFSVCFLGFTKDSECFFAEGDDYRVKVFRLADGTCLNNFEAPTRVSYLLEADGIIAVCDNYTVSLLNAEDFGRLAYVPYASIYLPDSQSFVLTSGRSAYKAGYKNYRELLDEAKRQFPDAELTEEKRVQYNIEGTDGTEGRK